MQQTVSAITVAPTSGVDPVALMGTRSTSDYSRAHCAEGVGAERVAELRSIADDGLLEAYCRTVLDRAAPNGLSDPEPASSQRASGIVDLIRASRGDRCA